MKNTKKFISLALTLALVLSAIFCTGAGSDDGVDGGQEGELPELSGFFDDTVV